jgi:endo-1,4-beta-xylanase
MTGAPDSTARLQSRRRFVGRALQFAGALAAGGNLPAETLLGSNAVAASSITGSGSLKAHAGAHRALYGSAVAARLLAEDEAYRNLLIEQCSIVVAENAMKWGPLRPTIDTYNFTDADALVAFAEQHGMKVRGHNLCWHRQLPTWFAAQASTANARGLLTDHIQKVAGRYAGRIHSWDVVNEAIEVNDGRPDGLRTTPWLALVGEDYIELAFRTAREADPQALLTYNEYGIENSDVGDEKKRAAVLELVRRLKTRKAPIDAVGIQSHIAVNKTYGAELAEFMREIRELGLQIFITEMDVNDRTLPADIPTRDAAVGALYGSYLDLVLKNPDVRAVLTWGITDRSTWLNGEDAREDHLPERCLPFGEVDGRPDQPVKAFFAMRTSFDHRRSARQGL